MAGAKWSGLVVTAGDIVPGEPESAVRVQAPGGQGEVTRSPVAANCSARASPTVPVPNTMWPSRHRPARLVGDIVDVCDLEPDVLELPPVEEPPRPAR